MNISKREHITFIPAAGVLLALAAIILASRPTRAAGPWYVAPGGSDGNACTGPGTACATINGAIAKASSGDTIYVATGTYTSTSGSEVVLLDKSATLSGGWDGTFTTQSGTSTVDGEDSRRGMVVGSGATAVVEHFTVQNGFTSSRGGGIYNTGILTLTNSTVTGNTADGGGGGIFSGVEYNHDIILALTNSTVSGNTTNSSGGGINNYWGTTILNDSIVSGNTANHNAGGIWNGNGTLTLYSSTVSGNVATTEGYGEGGGIWGGSYINNSTISGNRARLGGGLYNWQGGLALSSSTVSGNMANDNGGGIYVWGGTVTLQNSILAGNANDSSPDCGGSVSSSGYNLVGDTSGCTFTPGAGDLTGTNAKLGQLIGSQGVPRYHPLLSGSPAIDAGNPAGCTDHLGDPLDSDQHGVLRVGRCDIGAYEYTIPGPAANISAVGGTPQITPPFSTFGTPLQAAVLDSVGSPVSATLATFSAPASGASGTFSDSGTFTTTAVTDESGVAATAAFTANGLTGSYTVTATISGIVTPALFLLENGSAWYVAPGGDDDSDCQTPTTPCASINGALGKTGFTAGDTVFVGTGTYTGTGSSEVVLLDKNVILFGGWNGAFTTQNGISTIDGEGVRRGITVNIHVTAFVERFIVQNGFSYEGGGIYSFSESGVLTLTNSTVSGNMATSKGGGIFNYGNLTLNNSVVSGNTGGGGIYNDSSRPVILSNSTVSDNTGGGISGGTITLNNSTVSGNTGCGISGGTVTIDNSIVSGNTGGGISSGGLTLNSSTVSGNTGCGISNHGIATINNSTISGNTASNGGGIFNHGTTTINSSTISDNMATAAYAGGGGIFNDDGTVTLQNTILAGNKTSGDSPDCANTISSLGYNLIGDTTGWCNFTPTTGDLTNVDARLFLLIGSPGYHPLLPGSLAIDAGNPAGCKDHLGNPLVTDQRGVARVGRCDIGSYEFDPANDPLTYVSLPMVVYND